MYDLAGGFGDALFFVGVVWLAGLVRFASGFFGRLGSAGGLSGVALHRGCP
jgi:hypothetical protein